MQKYKKALSLILTAVMFLSTLPSSYAKKIAFIDNPDAIEDSSYSVVMLFCYDVKGELYATGSGFAAFDDGVFVTNYHVIDGAVDSIVAYTEGGMYFDIDETLAVDETNDIALLKTNVKTRMTLLPIGSAKEMKKGSKVIAIGSPQGMVNSVSSGLLTGYVNIDGVQLLQFDAAISEGSSGGALFDNDGEVIGITSSTLVDGNNLNFAVPIELAENLWKKYQAGETEPVEDSPLTIAEKYIYMEDYESAKAIYEELEYEEGINFCDYMIGYALIDSENYSEALDCFERLASVDYEDSKEILNYVRCLYAYELLESDDHSKLIRVCSLLSDAMNDGFKDILDYFPEIYDVIYKKAVATYNSRNYLRAVQCFKFLKENHPIEKTEQYLALARIRYSGSISTAEYKILINNLDFADTKEALVSRKSTALMYLTGKWQNEYGCTMTWDEDGYFHDGMPRIIPESDYYTLEDGIIYLWSKDRSSKMADKSIDIIDENHWKIYCYQNNTSYTMTRIS